MSFSAYAWKLYRESPEGKAAIARTVDGHVASIPAVRDAPAFRYDLFLLPDDESAEPYGADVTVDLRREIRGLFSRGFIRSHEEAEDLFREIVEDGLEWEKDVGEKRYTAQYGGGAADPEGFTDVYTSIEGLSAGLHECFPEFFFPYLFARRCDALGDLCDRYDIPFPDIPGKLRKRERALFYVAVNREMQRFRERNGLSPSEMNAFLYDFAPKDSTLGRTEDLPAPSAVWFVMGGTGGNGDFRYLDTADDSSISYWQGNIEARRGDIVLMWCVSPRSSLHSVWRVLDDGFNDPYFYYYSMIRIGRPVRIPPISFSELSRNSVFSGKSAVRSRFQGCSGTAFSAEEYREILRLASAKGFDIATLPEPPEDLHLPDVSLSCERDVETHLVEPLLRRLGFSEADWRYQPRIRMGRGERNVPDYVLGADETPGEEAGVALLESKFDISTAKERREAFVQAKSYALRLQADTVVLAARQGVWVFKRDRRSFDESLYAFRNWKEIARPEIVAELASVFGKHAIDAALKQRAKRR